MFRAYLFDFAGNFREEICHTKMFKTVKSLCGYVQKHEPYNKLLDDVEIHVYNEEEELIFWCSYDEMMSCIEEGSYE